MIMIMTNNNNIEHTLLIIHTFYMVAGRGGSTRDGKIRLKRCS